MVRCFSVGFVCIEVQYAYVRLDMWARGRCLSLEYMDRYPSEWVYLLWYTSILFRKSHLFNFCHSAYEFRP